MPKKESTKPFHTLESEIKSALLRMEHASNLADLGFWQWDAIENAVTFYSPGLIKILGYDPDSPPAEIFTEAGELAQIHPADRERWKRVVLEQDFTPDYSYDIEFRIIRPSGEIRYVREIGNAVDERTLFGTDQDITKYKTLELALIDARNIAEEANRAKSQFHSMISHELRTPLNGILGMAELLSDSKLDNEQRQKLEGIKSCGQDLLELIDKILDMGKIATNALDLRETPFNLIELVSKVTLPFHIRADKKGLSFQISTPEDAPSLLLGDEALLQRILSNLLDNAFKFTETGSVSLSICFLEKADPEAYREKYCTVRFSVSDTGCGIAAEFLDGAFSTYSQQDPTIMREYDGAGLGLPIVRHLVNLMGGKIEIQSELGKGTRVEVLLPFDSAPAEVEDSSKVSAQPQSERNGGLRVLVAEDSDTNAAIFREYLRKLGCQVTLVKNGKEAVESADKYPYDFILLDVHMPIMDGLQAAKKIKLGLGHSKPTIIAITADVFTKQLAELNEIGIDDVLIKPVTLEQLRAVLKN